MVYEGAQCVRICRWSNKEGHFKDSDFAGDIRVLVGLKIYFQILRDSAALRRVRICWAGYGNPTFISGAPGNIRIQRVTLFPGPLCLLGLPGCAYIPGVRFGHAKCIRCDALIYSYSRAVYSSGGVRELSRAPMGIRLPHVCTCISGRRIRNPKSKRGDSMKYSESRDFTIFPRFRVLPYDNPSTHRGTTIHRSPS